MTRFGISAVTEDFLVHVKYPRSLVYTQKNPDPATSRNIQSLMKIRHELSSESLLPLPYFYIEKKVFLGDASWQGFEQMTCPHDHLMLNYFDIYKPKEYKNLLYPREYANIEQSKVLKPERSLLSTPSFFFKKILLGTTLLPKSIVESLLEKDKVNKPVARRIIDTFSHRRCKQCFEFYTRLRKLRTVERFLFLKYQTVQVGRAGSRRSEAQRVDQQGLGARLGGLPLL